MEIKELVYTIEDKTITELLGVQNFSTKESAILEIVKNAYDANASNLLINLQQDDNKELILEITDNGNGMSEEDILEKWMHVGKSDKDYEFFDSKGNSRIYSGSKGIGRFALARLAEKATITSKTLVDQEVIWVTDWSKSGILKSHDTSKIKKGTHIRLEKLRDNWSVVQVKKLVEFLNRSYRDSLMEIIIIINNEEFLIQNVFAELEISKTHVTEISINFSKESLILSGNIESDEFKDEIKTNIADTNEFEYEIDLNHYKNRFNIETIQGVGDFNGKIFFALKKLPQDLAEKFHYKYNGLDEDVDSGIVLYRNSFSISSYDGKKDWLDLGGRARKSPAAASHKTGAWRVRANQVFGYINIDKEINKNLKDLSNRQGLDENEYYEIFIELIHLAFSEFERYRQSIIRNIIIEEDVESEKPLIDEVISNPKIILNFSEEQALKLSNEIKNYRIESKKIIVNKKEDEERYKYDVRILNSLATVGLKAASIAHDLQNDKNNIDTFYDDMVSALKNYKIWENITNIPADTPMYKNIPELMNRNKRINRKLFNFIEIMLENIEKQNFINTDLSVGEQLGKIKFNWEHDYSLLDITITNNSYQKLDVVNSNIDYFSVIFDNLILNSVQNNINSRKLNIYIEYKVIGKKILFKYKDDGIGLTEKYKKNPFKILEVHETSRENGHGLGMWIINNTLTFTRGKIIDIPTENGFCIDFEVGVH